jgi:hypothetical protein
MRLLKGRQGSAKKRLICIYIFLLKWLLQCVSGQAAHCPLGAIITRFLGGDELRRGDEPPAVGRHHPIWIKQIDQPL